MKEEFSLFPYLFFIYLYHKLMDSYFISGLVSVTISMLKLLHIFPVGAPSGYFLRPLDLSTSLHPSSLSVNPSGTLFSSQSWNQPFLKGPTVPFPGEFSLETKI